MAHIAENYPLYYDAINEAGLAMAGLRFPDYTDYKPESSSRDNIAPFELIPWVLGQCACVADAKQRLKRMNLVDLSFSPMLPATPLHWMVSDKKSSIVVESRASGLEVYDNPFEVLTNNPPFGFHSTNLSHYMALHTGAAQNRFREGLPLENYSLGMGALGLPGDFSSASRFVRAFFVKENAADAGTEHASVNQFFHILNSVAMPKGCVQAAEGFEYTRYSSCCNVDQGSYYYTTYDDFEIASINMYDAELHQSHLYTYDVKGLVAVQ
jgi:choloylglycine hydrolase